MPQVRILSLRPKNQERGSSSLLIFDWCVKLKLFCEAKCRFAFPARRSTSSLVRQRAWESRSVAKLPCHSDHMKIIRTFFYLEKRSNYLFYLSIPTLIVRNENSRYHGLLTMVSAFLCNRLLLDNIAVLWYNIIKATEVRNEIISRNSSTEYWTIKAVRHERQRNIEARNMLYTKSLYCSSIHMESFL